MRRREPPTEFVCCLAIAWKPWLRAAPMIMTRVPPPPDDLFALLWTAVGDCTVAAATTGWRLGLAGCLLGTLSCLVVARSSCRWLHLAACMS